MVMIMSGFVMYSALMLAVVSVQCLETHSSSSSAVNGIDQVKHVIIFMQENRAFDHYFGRLKGVRGFNDRVTVPLRSGLNAFYQPVDQDHLDEYMLPFHADSNKTNAMCMPAPEMYYPTDIKMWNSGRMDAWNTARDPGFGMSYWNREDLPYYYALYDEFVCGDQYHQSTFTCTNPNRLHLFSGTSGLSVGDGEFFVLENNEPRPGFNWTTMAEILEESNVTWGVYQELDNFDDNAFAWFANFQKSRPGQPLFDKGMMRHVSLIEAFRADLESNSLPQVSWIIAPTDKSEHATNHPCAGEDYTARLLQTLTDFPEIYAQSVFILNYDEGGQFYDHAWTPTPPLSKQEGIATMSVDGEINTSLLTDVPAPIGLGFRVPLLIVSPWTRGNIVVSEVFDHTSVIQFLEVKFNVHCPNLSPWRRAITGNLLSAFDFDHPDYSWPKLPDTSDYVVEGDIQCHTLPPPVVPALQSMPQQEPGVRRSRALPYEFLVRDEMMMTMSVRDVSSKAAIAAASAISLIVSVNNTGLAGAPFVLFDVINIATVNPRQYAIDSKKSIQDSIPLTISSNGIASYSYSLFGPNGFVRQFSGTMDVSSLTSSSSSCGSSKSLQHAQVSLEYDYGTQATGFTGVVLILTNKQSSSCLDSLTFTVTDNAYGLLHDEVKKIVVNSGQTIEFRIDTTASGNWYDLSVTTIDTIDTKHVSGSMSTSASYFRRFLGRFETGKDTISDPAMGQGLQGLWGQRPADQHPSVPLHLLHVERVETKYAEFDKDAKFRFDFSSEEL